jgi:KUP system potassium uptake protein
VITPAISVLSAVEGLKLVTPQMEAMVLPITVAILCCCSPCNRAAPKGGALLRPLTLIWFITLAIGGLIHIVDDVRVFPGAQPAARRADSS